MTVPVPTASTACSPLAGLRLLIRAAGLCSALAAGSAALAFPQAGTAPAPEAPATAQPAADAGAGEAAGRERVTLWLDMYRGEPLPFASVAEDLNGVDVVYVGETHTLSRHHQWQRRILEELIKAKDGKVVLGLEQIENFHQKEVDRFNEGKLTFDQLAERIDWGKRWSNYRDYRGLVELAQSNGVPVVALNGRAETIRKVGRQGIGKLSSSERRELPEEMNFDDPDYRRIMDQMLMVHAKIDESTLERIFQAQVARDEQMADSLAQFLQQPGNEGRAAMVVAGSGHVAYGLGMVDRVRRRMPDLNDRIVLMTVSGELVLSKREEEMARKVTITHEDLRFLKRPKADYLQLTEPGE